MVDAGDVAGDVGRLRGAECEITCDGSGHWGSSCGGHDVCDWDAEFGWQGVGDCETRC